MILITLDLNIYLRNSVGGGPERSGDMPPTRHESLWPCISITALAFPNLIPEGLRKGDRTHWRVSSLDRMGYAVQKGSILRLFEGVEPNFTTLLSTGCYAEINAFCNIFRGSERSADPLPKV
jgi:hypothetical protein